MFKQDFTCPALLKDSTTCVSVRGHHPLRPAFPDRSGYMLQNRWAVPRSLATTSGISVDFFSSGYLDVSVPRVPPYFHR